MDDSTSRRDFLKWGAAAGMAQVLAANVAGADGKTADLILTNGKLATQDERRTFASAIAIKDGRILAVGDEAKVQPHRGPATQVIDLQGRTGIPGLNDSHTHVIRGGLYYNMELRWDGVPSLADALRMLKEQAKRTPPPQWVRVVGGWNEFQFAERRLPTLDEINQAAPDTPVFVLNLYSQAFLNRAALRAVGYTRDTPQPLGGEIQRDKAGNPTGLLIAKPNALILYATLAKGPKLGHDDQVNSTRQFMRELNRLGVTSVCDAGGGFQNYPDDYQVITELEKQGLLTVRIAYNLFTQRPLKEKEDFANWIKTAKIGQGNDYFRLNGAGEMLVYSAADFEDIREPRPDLPGRLEADLKDVITLLAQNRWPFRLHATYDESISRFLNVFEQVNRDVPFKGLPWFFDHAETISDKNLERVKALNGAIAIQHRMAYQGELFVKRYGAQQTERTPPIARMLKMGIPVGMGTDATRVASYNPFIGLYWLVTGKTVGGLSLYSEKNRLDRMEALRLYTVGSTTMSSDQGKKGALMPGQLADLAILSGDYFSVPEEDIKRLTSVLTVVGGKVVYAAEPFAKLAPKELPVSPDWSPVKTYGGYHKSAQLPASTPTWCCSAHQARPVGPVGKSLWGLGCDCFAF